METKKCTKCKEEKPVKEFYINKTRKDGFASWCKICHKSYGMGCNRNSKYRDKNKDKIKVKELNCRKDLTDSYIKHRCKADGFTSDQIKEHPEIIEAKRLIIKTKRLCKTLQN